MSWIPHRRFPNKDRISSAFAVRNGLYVIADDELFSVNLKNSKDMITLLNPFLAFFINSFFVRHIPISTFLVYVTRTCRNEFVIFDYVTSSVSQKISVEGCIREVECGDTVIVICSESATSTKAKEQVLTVAIFSWDGKQCRRIKDAHTIPCFHKVSISSNGTIAFNDAKSRLNIYHVNEDRLRCLGQIHSSFLISTDGGLVVAVGWGGHHLCFYDTADLSMQSLVVPSNNSFDLLAISDDRRYILTRLSQYYLKILAIDYVENGRPTLAFAYDLEFGIKTFDRSFVFVHSAGVQYLHFVTQNDVLMKYIIYESKKTWLVVESEERPEFFDESHTRSEAAIADDEQRTVPAENQARSIAELTLEDICILKPKKLYVSCGKKSKK